MEEVKDKRKTCPGSECLGQVFFCDLCFERKVSSVQKISETGGRFVT